MKTKLIGMMLSAALCIGAGSASASAYTLKSPSGKLSLTVNTGRQLTWSVALSGREIIAPSVASVTLTDGSVWGPGAGGAKTTKVKRTIKTVNYKNATVEDSYEGLSLRGGKYTVEFRVYDDAVAYRFVAAVKDSVNIADENVEYNLTGDAKAWIPWLTEADHGERYSCSFESYYSRGNISQMPSDKLSILPLLCDMGGGVKVAVTDIGDIDYPGMYIHSYFSRGNGLKGEYAGYPDLKNSELGGGSYDRFTRLLRKDYIARIGGRQPLSWKVAIVTSSDAQLADCAIVQKLCAGTSRGDYSWVKPGKVAWDWWNALNITGVDFPSGMNTPTYKKYIDFAAANKLEYIIIDDGWKDGNILKYKNDLDIPELCRYGASKGVGVIIWLTWKDCLKYMDKGFPMYKEWGVKGLKIDFINGNDQYILSSLGHIARNAAKYHLTIDYHGMQLKGLQVANPNILSCEGVRGLEQCKWQPGKDLLTGSDMPGYDVEIPYIRQIIAPMDYTPGAMINASKADYRPVNDRPMSQGTRVHQMAMYTVFDSPLQMLSDAPTNYEKDQNCTDFIAKVPTVFDEAKTLSGEVGQYIVGARRKGSTWYVGAMSSWQGRELSLPLSFLGSGRYKAVIFADGVNANRNAEDYVRSEKEVTSTDVLKLTLKNGGGWTARFEKL